MGNNREGWPHFSVGELRCPHCGAMHMNRRFMEVIELIREDYGKPMVVTSAYRCPEYNDEISNTGLNGPHTTGRAMDIHVYGADALNLLHWSMYHGITGVGVNQTGNYEKRFVHLDQIENEHRPWIWTY